MIKLKIMDFKAVFMTLCLALMSFTLAAQVTVTGTVEETTGDPVIGATVREKGTGAGTTTDIDGNFSLKVESSNATLIVSYVGLETQEVKLEGKTKVNIVLRNNDELLDEVVVVGYGTQKKVTMTGAVSNVGSKELLKSPVANLGNALQGKLPGVQTVQYSGLPGADDPIIRVRGIGSLNSAEPLVLVDGVERSFTQIDPNEVADISILKDASATAVFGVRGANGVILVTTKRGDIGKPAVSVTASAAVQQVSDFIHFTDSYTYGKMHNYGTITDALPMSQWPGSATINDYSQYEDLGIRFSQTAMQHFKDGDMPVTYPSTDWLSYIMKDAAWQEQANVNVSGGSEKMRYFVSVGFFNQNSLFKTFSANDDETFKFNRYNYRANLDINVSKLSTLSLTLGGRVENRTTMGDGESFLFRYLQSATPYAGYGLDEEGRHIISDKALVGDYGRDALDNFYNLGYVLESKNTVNFDIQYKLDLSPITKGLDFKVKASYNSDYTAQKNRKNGFGSGTKYVATIIDGQEVLRKEGTTWPLPYSESRWGNRNWYAEASLNYARKFGKHNVTALALYNQSKRYYPWDADGSIYKAIPTGYVGLVGRATYDYDMKYMIDFNIGYNGSENFAKDKRYGVFPSASIGWIPSNESWWEPLKKTVGYLKLRASIGQVGNDNVLGHRFLYLPGAWEFTQGLLTVNPQLRGANFGTGGEVWRVIARELTNGNPDVTWETATKQNYGLDARLFNEKLGVNIDFFWEDRKDILVSNQASLPAVTSLPSSYVNRGRVKNHGYEIQLKWEDKAGDVYYSIAPGMTYATNKIMEQLEVPPMYPWLSRTGHSVGQPFGYEFFEFYDEGTEQRYQAKYGKPMPDQKISLKYGDAVFVDLNDDGEIDKNDMHAIGYTDVPELNYSLNMYFQYKGFDLSMLWIGADHVNRYLSTYYRKQFGSTDNSALVQWVADNSWTEDNRDAILPRISFSNGTHNCEDSNIWLINTAYARLKNLEVGYTFNKPKWMPLFNSVRFYVTGQNLLTFTSFKGNDPEAEGGNYERGVRYPMTRVYNFGVKVNF